MPSIVYHDMPAFVDEFETRFAKLERMGEERKIPELQKAPLLLVSMENHSPLESKVVALRTKALKYFPGRCHLGSDPRMESTG